MATLSPIEIDIERRWLVVRVSSGYISSSWHISSSSSAVLLCHPHHVWKAFTAQFVFRCVFMGRFGFLAPSSLLKRFESLTNDRDSLFLFFVFIAFASFSSQSLSLSLHPTGIQIASGRHANNPDIICIVETWLSSDILDSEVTLPGYQVHRLDRNRHGGGILVYVKDSFVSNSLSSPDNLELLTLSIANDINKVCLSLFYRPPHSPSDVFQDLFLYLQSFDTSQSWVQRVIYVTKINIKIS